MVIYNDGLFIRSTVEGVTISGRNQASPPNVPKNVTP